MSTVVCCEHYNRICEEIEDLRSEMVTLGIEFGFLHPEVQSCSRRLDQLLIRYYIFDLDYRRSQQTTAALESAHR